MWAHCLYFLTIYTTFLSNLAPKDKFPEPQASLEDPAIIICSLRKLGRGQLKWLSLRAYSGLYHYWQYRIVRNEEEYLTYLPSIDTVPILEHILQLLPAEKSKTWQQQPKMQSEFTVVSEGKVVKNMGFLVLQVKRGAGSLLEGGTCDP